MAKLEGLHCSVLRNADHGDCTNGGLTSRVSAVTLVGEGVEGPFEPTERDPGVKLVRRWAGTPREYLHAEPLEAPPAGHVGWMFGGNFIHTSDGRFPSRYPIPVHDRSETAADYARNFD